MTPTCRVCTRPTKDGCAVCVTCWTQLVKALAEIPALHADLELTLSRQTSTGERVGPRSSVKALPFDIKAGESLHELEAVLSSWCRLVEEESGDMCPGATMAALSRFLLVSEKWLRHHPAADDAHREILDTTRRAWLAVDLPSWKHFTVGPCAETDEAGQPCPGQVIAHLPADEKKPASLTCDLCHATYDSSQWRRIGERIILTRTSLETRQRQGWAALLDKVV